MLNVNISKARSSLSHLVKAIEQGREARGHACSRKSGSRGKAPRRGKGFFRDSRQY